MFVAINRKHAKLMKMRCIYNPICLVFHYQVLEFLSMQKVRIFAKNIAQSVAGLEKSLTFALPFEKRVADKAESSWKDCRRNKNSKIFAKRFGSLKIMRTFAAPVRKTGSRKRNNRSLFLRFFAKGERRRRELPGGND